MTPKQKAQELVSKMTRPINDDYYVDYNDYGKECALIAVEEILNSGKDVDEFCDSYWQEVKKEIELL